ncbi:MAG: acyl-CoA dehydrogenase [Rhodobacteraceae bacterium]|nr:acyl-CoA dehydrogenase [Paracoccaceae bacterium]
MTYCAPLRDYRFMLEQIVGLPALRTTERFADVDAQTVSTILTEAARLCEEVLAPLRRVSDQAPARLENGLVRTPPGFADAYGQIAQGGWIGTLADPTHGGMGLPLVVTTVINEMMASACLALQLNPVLTQGQIEALECHASKVIKALYLPRLITGEWSGTMNLTEPQAGSDVGALRTKASPNGDGTYAISGQKIYISWADNDFTANVCHLVLARLPGAKPGTAGISMFLVPKYLPDAQGNPGVANTLRVVSLEHKMGLHGSPTAVMHYDGAVGWLIGDAHAGMKCMFTMMNSARLGVGTQGVAAAEGAYQHALAYARQRRQGSAERGRFTPTQRSGTILDHADVRRMLITMKAETFAARAIVLACAQAIDMSKAKGGQDWKARAAFLTPIAKAFGTDTGMAVSDMGLQVHGGMGYIEETGAAQFYRDVRVTAIYEGTNGIQAMDLVGRKLADGGATAFALIEEIAQNARQAQARHPSLAEPVLRAAQNLRAATAWMLAQGDMGDRCAGAVPFLAGFARVLGGHYHLRAACAQPQDNSTQDSSTQAKLARFYIARLLPQHQSLLAQARCGADDLYALADSELGA